MRPDTYKKYSSYFTSRYMMGPNAIRLLDEMLTRCPLEGGSRILDLGCGTGLSSLYLAGETAAEIFAVDLWCSATDNLRRFLEWGVADRVVPIHADALELPFADGFFDHIVSVDAYHYFACNPEYFAGKLLPLVKRGGSVRIVVPGLKEEFGETVPPEILDWAGDEYRLFHSCGWWEKTIGTHPDIASLKCFLLTDDGAAWQEWFDSGHQYAAADQQFFARGIGRYLSIVGISVEKAR